MTKGTTEQLGALHGKMSRYFEKIVDDALRDTEDPLWLPLDAATIGQITKFLKDNEITADITDNKTLGAIRDKIAKAAEERTRRQVAGAAEFMQSPDQLM